MFQCSIYVHFSGIYCNKVHTYAVHTDLGSLFLRTRLTNVSISAAVMCFSSSFLLLCSRAVMVSSASTSYPICFCIKRNCFAMYSYNKRHRKMLFFSVMPAILKSQIFIVKQRNSALLGHHHCIFTSICVFSLHSYISLRFCNLIFAIILL